MKKMFISKMKVNDIMSKKRKNYVGMESNTRFGTIAKIICFNGYNDIIIEFQDEYKTQIRTSYSSFINKQIKNPYDKSIHNVGYLGVGKYKTKMSDGKDSKCYTTWRDMIQRCYDKNFQIKNKSYKNCYVCNEWLNYQNFSAWFYENYYEVSDDSMCLDKDIICKGNIVYCPEYCVFAPKRINCMFISRNRNIKKSLIGVSYIKSDNTYQVQTRTSTHGIQYIGRYKDRGEAFSVYKSMREKYIKEIALLYKDKIDPRLYNAMISYEVGVND